MAFYNPSIFCCPNCSLKLAQLDKNKFACGACGAKFRPRGGVLSFYWPNEWHGQKDVTVEIKKFYEKTPFPNYDEIDSVWKLREKASESVFVKLLDEQIPAGANVLEAGCGTGQTSNLLGIKKDRKVFATDICQNSLGLAESFRKKSGISNVVFLQMNLFKPAFKPKSFDIVISNGVLHHTSNPELGFATIGKLVKPGGYIIIGLYNAFSRKTTDLRRLIFNISNDRLRFLDPYVKSKDLSAIKKETWFRDQYKNPHESEHTIDEVLSWFDKNCFEFVNSIPKATVGSEFSDDERLFKKNPRGNRFNHWLVQLESLLVGGPEGGFFTMIGRKKK